MQHTRILKVNRVISTLLGHQMELQKISNAPPLSYCSVRIQPHPKNTPLVLSHADRSNKFAILLDVHLQECINYVTIRKLNMGKKCKKLAYHDSYKAVPARLSKVQHIRNIFLTVCYSALKQKEKLRNVFRFVRNTTHKKKALFMTNNINSRITVETTKPSTLLTHYWS